MNLEKFTDRAKGFLQSAQTVAIRMSHQQIAPEHLLKALLEDEQGMASGLITAAGGDPKRSLAETDAALALLVFLAVIWFGIRTRGLRGYLGSFAAPTILMLPLNLVENVTRTFSMMVRLFGNVMSGVFVIGIVLSLAGLLVPIPLMALDLLTGAVQAYIFAVLAMVFIGSAVSEGEPE